MLSRTRSRQVWGVMCIVSAVGLTLTLTLRDSEPEAPARATTPASSVLEEGRPFEVRGRAGGAPPDGRADQALDARLGALTQRLAALEVAQAAPATPSAPMTPEAHEAQLREEVEGVVADLEAQVSQHHASPLEGAWAAQTGQAIEEDLRPLLARPDNRAVVEKIDCRSKSCITTLRFSSRDEALANYADFVTAAYHVSCTTTAILPPADATGEVRVEVLFVQCASGGRPG